MKIVILLLIVSLVLLIHNNQHERFWSFLNGPDGPPGTDGKSTNLITDIIDNKNGSITIQLNDSKTYDLLIPNYNSDTNYITSLKHDNDMLVIDTVKGTHTISVPKANGIKDISDNKNGSFTLNMDNGKKILISIPLERDNNITDIKIEGNQLVISTSHGYSFNVDIPFDPNSKGPIGDEGLPGLPGMRGLFGSSGTRGVYGSFGDIGLKGPIGARGIIGVTGSKGAKGDIGLRGRTGSTGVKGVTGSPGERGPKGTSIANILRVPGQNKLTVVTDNKTSEYTIPVGEKGPQGDMGQYGSRGISGQQGIKGEVGPPGPVGPPGNRGIAGPKGTFGRLISSIYKSDNKLKIQMTDDPENMPSYSFDMTDMKGEKGEQGYKGPPGELVYGITKNNTGIHFDIDVGVKEYVIPTDALKGDTGDTGPLGYRGYYIKKIIPQTNYDGSKQITIYQENGSYDEMRTIQMYIPKGLQGDKGRPGDTGRKGPKGDDAVIISDASLNSDDRYNKFDVVLTDGRRFTLPLLKGYKGRTIESISYEGSSIIFNMTDKTTHRIDDIGTYINFVEEYRHNISLYKTDGSQVDIPLPNITEIEYNDIAKRIDFYRNNYSEHDNSVYFPTKLGISNNRLSMKNSLGNEVTAVDIPLDYYDLQANSSSFDLYAGPSKYRSIPYSSIHKDIIKNISYRDANIVITYADDRTIDIPQTIGNVYDLSVATDSEGTNLLITRSDDKIDKIALSPIKNILFDDTTKQITITNMDDSIQKIDLPSGLIIDKNKVTLSSQTGILSTVDISSMDLCPTLTYDPIPKKFTYTAPNGWTYTATLPVLASTVDANNKSLIVTMDDSSQLKVDLVSRVASISTDNTNLIITYTDGSIVNIALSTINNGKLNGVTQSTDGYTLTFSKVGSNSISVAIPKTLEYPKTITSLSDSVNGRKLTVTDGNDVSTEIELSSMSYITYDPITKIFKSKKITDTTETAVTIPYLMELDNTNNLKLKDSSGNIWSTTNYPSLLKDFSFDSTGSNINSTEGTYSYSRWFQDPLLSLTNDSGLNVKTIKKSSVIKLPSYSYDTKTQKFKITNTDNTTSEVILPPTVSLVIDSEAELKTFCSSITMGPIQYDCANIYWKTLSTAIEYPLNRFLSLVYNTSDNTKTTINNEIQKHYNMFLACKCDNNPNNTSESIPYFPYLTNIAGSGWEYRFVLYGGTQYNAISNSFNNLVYNGNTYIPKQSFIAIASGTKHFVLVLQYDGSFGWYYDNISTKLTTMNTASYTEVLSKPTKTTGPFYIIYDPSAGAFLHLGKNASGVYTINYKYTIGSWSQAVFIIGTDKSIQYDIGKTSNYTITTSSWNIPL